MIIIDGEGIDLIKEDFHKILEIATLVIKDHIEANEVEVCLTITDNDNIKLLNKEFRNLDYPTDVLSFPLIDNLPDFYQEYVCLGDIVISLDKVIEQACEYSHSRRRELVFLFLHGLLHLLGYDHLKDDERDQMTKLEDKYMGLVSIGR